MLKKLKSWLSDDALYIGGVLLLVGIVSFGLGRLSVGDGSAAREQSAAVGLLSNQNLPKSTMVSATSAAEVTPVAIFATSSATLVGSKSGTKYHRVTCPGAKTIKDSNKIYFQSESEAEAAGYSRAANCKW
jgi:hypothetical protein